jgi:lipid-binding SYLF domain-containing protein
LSGRAAYLLLLGLASCGGARASVPASPPSPPSTAGATPLAALAATALCPEVTGRTLSAASASDGVIDTFVRVGNCAAQADGDQVHVTADAIAWMGVEHDFGAVAIAEFVHATVHIDARARVAAAPAGDAIAISLTPLGDANVSVVPVGAFDASAQNWAALAAIELAPSVGVSPEAFAKRRFQLESESALRAALARPTTVTYDPRTGVLGPNTHAPETRATRLRILPGGSAEVGAFPPKGDVTKVRVRTPHTVSARGICLSHADHLREADRRGQTVTVDGWAVAEGDVSVEVPPMPCPWTFAVRARDAHGAVAEVELPPSLESGARGGGQTDRWVALDDASLTERLDDPSLRVIVATEAWHSPVGVVDRAPPGIVILAPDEELVVRLVRGDRDKQTTEQEVRLPLERTGDFAREVAVATRDGSARTVVLLRARVRVADVKPSSIDAAGNAIAGAGATHDSSREEATLRIERASAIVSELRGATDGALPIAVARQARCVAVVPGLVHAAFLVGARAGRGVVTCREAEGWSKPSFIALGGASAGLAAGVEKVDLVMLVMTAAAENELLHGELRIGAHGSLAAGPVGRNAEAATDLSLRAPIVYLSRANGLFVGLDLAGTTLDRDEEAARAFYGDVRDFGALLRTPAPPPPAAARFSREVARTFRP